MTQETVVSVPYLVQVSVLVGRKTLFLYNLHDPDNPVELAFQQRYGSVVTYKWYVYCVQTLSV
jgi:WD repeat-containing protein 19